MEECLKCPDEEPISTHSLKRTSAKFYLGTYILEKLVKACAGASVISLTNTLNWNKFG